MLCKHNRNQKYAIFTFMPLAMISYHEYSTPTRAHAIELSSLRLALISKLQNLEVVSLGAMILITYIDIEHILQFNSVWDYWKYN